MIHPFNDHVLVELPKHHFSTAEDSDERNDPISGTGVVVGIPALEDIHYLTSYTWVAEESIFNAETAKEMAQVMQRLKGKKVYFEKRSDHGNTIEESDKSFALIKLSKITAVEA